MTINLRKNLIKTLQLTIPRGEPFDLAGLKALEISAVLAAKYAESGWLVRLGQGVYAFAGDDWTAHGGLKLLQRRVPGLHVAGKSALALQGVRHNLALRETLVLWGDSRLYRMPEWFTQRYPARYVGARLFDWSQQESLEAKTLHTPPGVTKELVVSVPERAVLELLHDVGTKQDVEEAMALFESLRSPRIAVMGQLLSCCTSVKTVRLFLTWARETELLDVDALLSVYSIPVGSSSRWVTRLKDGNLMSLKPLG